MEKITYLLTYLLTHSLKRIATRPPLQLETLHLPPYLSLSLEISSWRMRAHLWRKGCGGGAPSGPSPITSVVRPTSAYFDKSSRSTFCVSVARFSHLNSRLNRVANTYLLTYLLTYSTTVVCRVPLDIGKNEKRFHGFKLRIKILIYIMLIAPSKIIVTLNDVISPVHLRS